MEKRVKKERKQVNLHNVTPKEEILKQLGQTLKTTRKEKGFSSFEHLAYQMDIGRSLFAKYEAGSDMRVSTLFRIIEAMDIEIADFFADFRKKNKTKTTAKK